MILASQSMMSRFIHFTNAEGYAMNDEVLQKTAILIWGWHAVITHYPKVILIEHLFIIIFTPCYVDVQFYIMHEKFS